MNGNRRLPKRSIIGTKVCALWQDGRLYPGVIFNQPPEESFFQPRYTIQFDDGYLREVTANEIVAPGFATLGNFTLKSGQKVFLTLNGREISGTVVSHDRSANEVNIITNMPEGQDIEICRQLEDVRILPSRKSARLLDSNTDYSRLADVTSHTEKRNRTVSHVIDVPTKFRNRQRHESEQEENDKEINVDEEEDVEMMDETIAAMVLTSLSCSPKSPQFPLTLAEAKPHSPVMSSSVTSSGFHSERSDPSPPSHHHLSGSAPAASSGWGEYGAFHKDDGIMLEEEDTESDEYEPKKKRRSDGQRQDETRTMFQCTWKGCRKICTTCDRIEQHVRTEHLGISSANVFINHEEEFYYTEIEVNVDTVTETFSDMCTSSPPDSVFETGIPIPDHDYQKKETRVTLGSSVPTNHNAQFSMVTQMESQPINMPQMKRSLSWQNNTSGSFSISPSPKSSKPTMQERLQMHQAQSPKSHSFSPKGSSSHKKPRSEVRKCRKVYGMENRDMWCTQCKWKKACSRFVD